MPGVCQAVVLSWCVTTEWPQANQRNDVDSKQLVQYQVLAIYSSIKFNKSRNLVRNQGVGGSNPLSPTTILVLSYQELAGIPILHF